MQAVVNTKYGPPESLQLREVKTPIPKDNEIRVKVHAATVTAGDCELRRFQIGFLYWLPLRMVMGVFSPRINILGQEFSGVIDTVGKDVSDFQPGDQVFAPTDMKMGAYAEYKCLSQKHPIGKKPENVSFHAAATISTGGLNALHFLRIAKLQAGESMLIIGAGGSIGTYGVQLAKSYGASVTAVDSGEKLDMLRSIGADLVIDYTMQDYTKDGKTYDVVFDIVGKWWSETYTHLLKANGRYLVTNPGITTLLKQLFTSKRNGKRVINGLANYSSEDLAHLAELVSEGTIKPVIDKIHPLEQIRKAHQYVDDGHKKGNLVISIP